MKDRVIYPNQLVENHGVYNATVIAKNGTRFTWNNTLGISAMYQGWPVIDVSGFPEIQQYIDRMGEQLEQGDEAAGS
jgi:hypothetical protein